jgi:hypothetical protein
MGGVLRHWIFFLNLTIVDIGEIRQRKEWALDPIGNEIGSLFHVVTLLYVSQVIIFYFLHCFVKTQCTSVCKVDVNNFLASNLDTILAIGSLLHCLVGYGERLDKKLFKNWLLVEVGHLNLEVELHSAVNKFVVNHQASIIVAQHVSGKAPWILVVFKLFLYWLTSLFNL